MKIAVCVCICLFTVLSFAPFALADFINGGFETGNLAGWSSIGDATVFNSCFGVVPAQGTYQALISSAPSLGDLPSPCGPFINNTYSGTNGVDATSNLVAPTPLEAFLGLPATSIYNLGQVYAPGLQGGGLHGSAIQQSFIADGGAVLSFKFDYLTNDFGDFAFLVLDGAMTLLAGSTNGCTHYPIDALPFAGSTVSPTHLIADCGYRTFATTLTTAGTHTLGIAVNDWALDGFYNSVVLIDAVTVTPGTPVPEPSTWLLLGSGLIGLVICKRFRRPSRPQKT